MSSSVRKSREKTEARLSLASGLTILPGIGARRADLLGKMGIDTIGDLLLHAPRRYIDRSAFSRIADLKVNSTQTVVGRVVRVETKLAKQKHLTIAHLDDASSRLACIWFNQPYLARTLKVGTIYVVSGSVSLSRFGPTMFHPEYEPYGDELLHTGRLVPVYPVRPGISQKQMRKLTKIALDRFGSLVKDLVPNSIRRKLNLPGLDRALYEVHYPASPSDAEQARRRLAFDEVLLLQTIFAISRAQRQVKRQARQHDLGIARMTTFLPFTLTSSQQRALELIIEDLRGNFPMRRLLLGDVGCGKTVVASLAAAWVCLNGGQVALMCPTEILAEQHLEALSRYLFPFGISVALLTGSMMAEERQTVKKALATGKIKAVVGTHALLGESIDFHDLRLVVVDEEQRFGVIQRSKLIEKRPEADLLVLTATPIPRTMALAVYDDLDVTLIDEKPPGGGNHTTRVVSERERSRVIDEIVARIKAGEQGFFICPALEEGSYGLRNVRNVAAEMGKLIGKDALGILTGQTQRDTRAEVLERFASGKIRLIVATSVIEVGMDIESATFLVVDQAERFGLSQLHQMRGRVARGNKDSVPYFVVSDSASEIGRQRVKILETTSDGFEVAECDLALRGPGDLIGKRQHGIPDLRFARLPDDTDLMLVAKEEAFTRILGGDSSEEWRLWTEAVREYVKGNIVIV